MRAGSSHKKSTGQKVVQSEKVAADPRRQFWVSVFGGVFNSAIDESTIRQMMATTSRQLQLMPIDDKPGSWKTPEELGIVSQTANATASIRPVASDETVGLMDATLSDERHQFVDDTDIELLTNEDLRDKIRAVDKKVCVTISAVQKAVNMSVVQIVAIGKALKVIKGRLKHGEWGPWLEANLPNIPQCRITRYMRTASQIVHVHNLDQITTVRQAYLVTRVMKEPSSTPAGKKFSRKTDLTPVAVLAHLRSLNNLLEAGLTSAEMAAADDAIVAEMAAEVDQIVDLFGCLKQRRGESAIGPAPATLESGHGGKPYFLSNQRPHEMGVLEDAT